MANNSQVFHGVIHGRTIVLQDAPDLPQGQLVHVTVQPDSQAQPSTEEPREALKRAAGSWTDDLDGLDHYLEWNRQQRKVQRPEIPE